MMILDKKTVLAIIFTATLALCAIKYIAEPFVIETVCSELVNCEAN